MPNFADFCASMCRDFKQIRTVVFSNGPDLLMNPTAPLSNFEVTQRGMSGLGCLLLNPTARLEMSTVLGADSTARLIGSRAGKQNAPRHKSGTADVPVGSGFSLPPGFCPASRHKREERRLKAGGRLKSVAPHGRGLPCVHIRSDLSRFADESHWRPLLCRAPQTVSVPVEEFNYQV
jgi:hypothetical protein